MKTDNPPFIFYLTLNESLPRAFYTFDKAFKERGFILVPVELDELQKLASLADQTQIIVISSVIDTKELKLFNEKVRGLLKYVLKSKRLTYMQLSSFSRLNDTKSFALTKNYFFMKYPLDARSLCAKIARYYNMKSESNVRWPGGRRAKLGAVA